MISRRSIATTTSNLASRQLSVRRFRPEGEVGAVTHQSNILNVMTMWALASVVGVPLWLASSPGTRAVLTACVLAAALMLGLSCLLIRCNGRPDGAYDDVWIALAMILVSSAVLFHIAVVYGHDALRWAALLYSVLNVAAVLPAGLLLTMALSCEGS